MIIFNKYVLLGNNCIIVEHFLTLSKLNKHNLNLNICKIKVRVTKLNIIKVNYFGKFRTLKLNQ